MVYGFDVPKLDIVSNGRIGLFCDLDLTVFDTNIDIILDLIHQHNLANKLNPKTIDPKKLISMYGTVQEIPEFQNIENLNETVINFYDDPKNYENLNIIKPMYDILIDLSSILNINYLTARSLTLEDVSRSSLSNYKFPVGGVNLRPNDVDIMEGLKYKVDVLNKTQNKILCHIDDSKSLYDLINPEYKGLVVIYGHDLISKKSNVVFCPTASDVKREVLKFYAENKDNYNFK